MTFVRSAVFLLELTAWTVTVVLMVLARWWWAAAGAAVALGADVVGRVWSRRWPVPLPSYMGWLLLFPRGPQSPRHLTRILRPRRGEYILEIGPGLGQHAAVVASAVGPEGRLNVLDIQQSMLDHVMRRAADAGITNIVPTRGDARELPFRTGAFDAAYVLGVLGEVPEVIAALCELRRVLRPGGRLIVGELLIDPDFIALPTLRAKAVEAGLTFVRRVGPRVAYWAIFEADGSMSLSARRSAWSGIGLPPDSARSSPALP